MPEASPIVEVDEALPDDLGKLKQLVLELRGELAYEKEKYKALVNMHFGPSSEKTRVDPPGQQAFAFDEAEAGADPTAEPSSDVVHVKEHAKR